MPPRMVNSSFLSPWAYYIAPLLQSALMRSSPFAQTFASNLGGPPRITGVQGIAPAASPPPAPPPSAMTSGVPAAPAAPRPTMGIASAAGMPPVGTAPIPPAPPTVPISTALPPAPPPPTPLVKAPPAPQQVTPALSTNGAWTHMGSGYYSWQSPIGAAPTADPFGNPWTGQTGSGLIYSYGPGGPMALPGGGTGLGGGGTGGPATGGSGGGAYGGPQGSGSTSQADTGRGF